MTISGILSRFGVFRPQIKEQPKIQQDEKTDGIAKIWHLLDGSKVRLICNHDTIECEVITGKKSSKVRLPLPEDFTPNQEIDRLKDMQPILSDDHTVEFRERQEKLHKWTIKDQSPISLIRIGEELYYQTKFETSDGENQTVGEKIPTPTHLSLSKRIKWVMQRRPHVFYTESTCRVAFQETPIVTWNLPNGDKVILVSDTKNIECQLIKGGENKGGWEIPFPETLTQQKMIDYLWEVCPVVDKNLHIEFKQWGEEICRWTINDVHSAKLTCVDEALYTQIRLTTPEGEKKCMIDKVCTPNGLSLLEQIAWVTSRYPHISRTDSTCTVTFHEKSIEEEYIYPDNIVETWNLGGTRKAHVIWNGETIEYQVVDEKDKVRIPVPIPDTLTSKEYMHRLLDIYPIFQGNEFIPRIERKQILRTSIVEDQNPVTSLRMSYFFQGKKAPALTEQRQILGTWTVKYENPVIATCLGESLYYETMYKLPYGGQQLEKKKIETPNGLSLFQSIAWVMQRHPHVCYEIGKEKKGKWKVKFQEETTREISLVDGQTVLDQDQGCVTLFNQEHSDSAPCTWMGHATLVIETIEKGGYFARVAHLLKSRDEKSALIKFFETTREDLEDRKKYNSKTPTWRRPKKDIQKMLDQIFFEVTSQREGNPLISFSLDGSKINFPNIVLLMADPEQLDRARVYRRDPTSYNCIEYAMRNLLIAGIKDDSKEQYLWSKHLLRLPVQHTGSRSKAIAGEITALALRAAVFTGVTLPFTYFLPITYPTRALSLIIFSNKIVTDLILNGNRVFKGNSSRSNKDKAKENAIAAANNPQ